MPELCDRACGSAEADGIPVNRIESDKISAVFTVLRFPSVEGSASRAMVRPAPAKDEPVAPGRLGFWPQQRCLPASQLGGPAGVPPGVDETLGSLEHGARGDQRWFEVELLRQPIARGR